MKPISPNLNFLLSLARVQAVLARRFDSRLGGGLGLSDFVILYHLSLAEDEKLRRVDLAEKVGLTASGVTRLLAPMEKIGLITREADARDARVSFVLLASGGKRLLSERLERAELLAEEAIPSAMTPRLEELSALMIALGGTVG
jgi:DNA-binding MarR family transcriptional regulator